MDIADVLRFIFYIWLLAAVVYWCYRGYNRFLRGSADDLAERATIGADPAEATEAPALRPPARRTMRQVLDDQQAAKEPGPEVKSGDLVGAVLKEEIAARKAREAAADGSADADAADEEGPGAGEPGGSERRGLFAPATEEDAPVARASVSELLDGIRMPCDLVPLINADVMPSVHHVVFVTTGHSPATIGSSIGDELERLGFSLRSESDTEVLATREGAKLRVILHPDAQGATQDGSPRFPSVPGGSVAVEFRS